jgi:phosphoglycerate-specific signal transduction histidine kinase
MGISSIGDVLDYVKAESLKQRLADCKRDHEVIEKELRTLLNRYQDEGKELNPMAKGMSWIKTNVMLAVNESDGTIADLMTDGCDMGVKSLSKYLNRYQAADETSKNIAKRLIRLEEQLSADLRGFL